MLSRLLGAKGGWIFSIICIIIGAVFFIFFDGIKDSIEGPHSVRHSFILSFLIDNLGRYGTSGFFIGGGALVGLRSWLMMRNSN